MSNEFKRQDYMRYSKIGRNRKRLQKWRRPKGRDSKMRLKRKSYPKSVSIGYKTAKKDAGRISSMTPLRIHNIKELNTARKNVGIIIAKVSAKKKLELIKHAQEKKIKILNIKTSETI